MVRASTAHVARHLVHEILKCVAVAFMERYVSLESGINELWHYVSVLQLVPVDTICQPRAGKQLADQYDKYFE